MDAFPTDELVWFVAIDPVGPRNPIVAIVGKRAQALADNEPQLASILWHIGVRQRHFQIHSWHAEALLLHMAEEPAASVAHHYRLALQTIVDLWDTATETHLVKRPLELPGRKWIHHLLRRTPAPSARRLRPWPTELLPARFPERGGVPTAIDHARWLCEFGRYSKGVAILEKYLQEYPDDWEAHFSLGQLCDLAKEPGKSVPHFQCAAELVPDNADVWNALGIAYGSLGDHVDACAAFKREAMLTDDFGAWMNLAMMSLSNGDTRTARDAASRAQRQSTDDPLLLFLLTVLARREKNHADAERLLAQAERALRRLSAAPRDAIATLALVKEARRSS